MCCMQYSLYILIIEFFYEHELVRLLMELVPQFKIIQFDPSFLFLNLKMVIYHT